MLKKCPFLFILLAVGMASAATHTSTTPNQDDKGCYLISDADELYGFAALVNGTLTEGRVAEPAACGKLTADIVVNTSVLGTNNANVNSETGEYQGSNASSFRPWVSIGGHKTDFRGTFDGQGHTISGLFLNAGESYSNVGLFGSVAGEPGFNATIKNVGIKDSYFRAGYWVGGVVGYVYGNGSLNIENVFNAAYVVAVKEDYGLAGGLVGYVENGAGGNLLLNITNAYNTGSIKGKIENLVGGLVGKVNVDVYGYDNGSTVYVNVKNAFNYGDVAGSPIVASMVYNEDIHFNIQNSFYLAEESAGMGKTAEEFANGSVFALLHSGENGDVWSQNQDDSYSMLFQSADESGVENPAMHVAVLHYSETDSVVIAYTEGTAFTLPATLPDGSIVVGDWYKSNSLSGDTYTQIAATEDGDLAFYAKAMKLDSDGYYEIADADMLFKFADLVNNQNSTYGSVKAKLTADIVVNQNVLGANNANVNADGSYNNAQAASGFTPWTPIGNSTNKFQGAFNGQGHTISGLYFNNNDVNYVGLFGYTSGAVTIEGVGVVDSYFRGSQYVGGLVGYWNRQGTSKLSVKNSYNTGSVNGNQYVGGLVGGNASNQSFNVENSYNSGSVNGTKYVGGLIGNPGDIKFSYNVGSVTGTSYVGGLAGMCNSIADSYNTGLVEIGGNPGNAMMGSGCEQENASSSKISNSYYLEGSGTDCGPRSFSGTTEEFANGYVALKLHNNIAATGASIWGQVVGADKTPTLTGEIVFPITLDNSDNCYEISNADDLYIFAAIVNSGFKSDACGKLTENIVVNENVLTSAGELNTASVGGFKEWTPIGNWDNPFQGTFHGQGLTISGLYFSDTKTDDVGLFGDVYGTVTIDSVGLVDSYIMAGSYVGGLVGFARGSLTISNSYNASSVTSNTTFGGLVGAAGSGSSLAISNSYNVGSLNGGGYGGGLVGYANALVVSNSYNAGAIYNSDEKKALVGGITSSVDDASTVTNSFNYGTISYPSNIEVVVDDLVAEGGEGIVIVTNSFSIGTSRFEGDGSTKKSAIEFADGTVFAALRNAEDGEVWRQYENDAYPTFAAKTGTDAPAPMHVAVLHYSETDSVVIIYTEGTALTLPTEDKSGNPITGWTTFADGTGDVLTEIPATATGDLKLYPKLFAPNAEGFYEIATADDLYKFAAIVNGGNATAKAKLMNDICVNACGEGESVLGTGNANIDATTGAYTGSTTGLREWIPIGNFDHPFIGTFDGQGHTISGLYFNAPDEPNVGLFGYVSGEDVTVSIGNVGVEDSYFNAQSAVGGVIGYVGYVALNIKNVYNAAVVVGAYEAGGIVGSVNLDVQTLSMVNVYNVGSISGTEETDGKTGGLVGYFMNDLEESKVTIKNSYNYGNVVGGDPLVGKVENDYEGYVAVMVTNSFYLGSSISGDYGTAKSSAEFANGTVFAALHSAEGGEDWLQYAGDAYPTLVEKTGTGAPASMHVAVLHYSETDSVVIAYTEGTAFTLPAEDKEGKALSGWTTSEDGTGDVLTEIPTTATGDLKLYPKLFAPNAEGYYEIATVEQLYEFAQIVNGGNTTAKAKLMNDIVVNENVLNADGSLNSSGSFEPWTPIGTSDKPFAGVFDGQGYSISGLYVNDDASGNVGLFGAVSANTATDAPASTIKNVGVVDSYFSGDENVGAIVGLVKGTITIQYVYSESAVAGSDNVGGLVGDVGASASFTASEIYNAGSVTAPDGKDHGGILGAAESGAHAQITDGFNYGTVSNGGGDIVGGADASSVVYVSDVYHLAASSGYDGYSAADFENGTVLSKLREQSRVWVQNPGDKYPTIDVNASGSEPYTIVLDWTKAEDKVNLKSWLNKYGDGATFNVSVAEGKTFYADGKIYRGDISEDVSDICDNNKTLYPISGVELETVGDKLVAILDGRDREEGGTAPAVMIPFDLVVDKVIYKREMTAGIYKTVMLPFNVANLKLDAYSNYGFYRFTRMDENVEGYRYMATVYRVRLLQANMPYIMKNIGETDTEGIVFEGDGRITLNTVSSGSREFSATSNGITWSMKGVYENKVWKTGDSEIGSAYLFAGQKKDGYKIGEFAKLGAGASLQPMRIYLLKDALAQLNRPGMFGSVNHYVEPESIGVRFVDDEEFDEGEETMVEKRITVIPTVIKSNRWFDMKGRALDSKPTAKGNYYYNGKRITIK